MDKLTKTSIIIYTICFVLDWVMWIITRQYGYWLAITGYTVAIILTISNHRQTEYFKEYIKNMKEKLRK